MKNKLVSASEAAGWVESGSHLGIGSGMEMNPMPVIREVIKNGVRDLLLTSVLTGGYVADLMIGAGCVKTIQFAQIVMDELGLAPNFKRMASEGKLSYLESACPVLLQGLQAGAQGLPFTPVIGLLNSDYMKIRMDFRVMTDPFNGGEYVVVPPIVPDVAIIHAYAGDVTGAVVTDSFRNDRLLAMAARKTIAVVERIVEPEELLPGPYGVYVSSVHVDAVVHAPGGAHPTGCREHYGADYDHLGVYMEAARQPESFGKYLSTYITGPRSHEEYLSLVGRGGRDE